ncbi:hypothetical protein GCM10019059_32140 [Camelimonas fluminis]|uniref:DUF2845 domain-containing protein n=1 Tax=Camelimonas fluminis TaxID=1576911 RepID=A0ABV7UIS6_9HYPH|nr:hypothetical protein [Camelimonas fluminis]GHE69959.1 hypothetical protein GCM10019059_32140 [Camelimonas fluminis]
MKAIVASIGLLAASEGAHAASLELSCTTPDSTTIAIKIDGPRWSFAHRLPKGGVIKREAQYEIFAQVAEDGDYEWQGDLRKNRSVRMVGVLKATGAGQYAYSETVYDEKNGGKKVASVSASCMPVGYEPASSEQAQAPSAPVQIPVLPPAQTPSGPQPKAMMLSEATVPPATAQQPRPEVPQTEPAAAAKPSGSGSGSGFPLLVLLGAPIAAVIGIKSALRRRRRERLIQKYGSPETVDRIMRREIWQGMTQEMLVDARGEPVDFDIKTMRSQTRLTYKYNQDGKNRFRTRIMLEDGVVIGWEMR